MGILEDRNDRFHVIPQCYTRVDLTPQKRELISASLEKEEKPFRLQAKTTNLNT